MNETSINPPYDYEIKQEEEIEKLEQELITWQYLGTCLSYKHQANVKREVMEKIRIKQIELEQLKTK